MKNSKFTWFVVLAGLFLGWLPAAAELTEREVRAYLKQGALVVDVRSRAEFEARHLAGVTNIPLPELKERIASVVTNRSAAILLHCQTGRRSGAAEGQLRQWGYTNVFNLGGYKQAEKILPAAR
jgi:phage shock protein E